MVRTEISLFLENIPGELAKLTAMLEEAGMNIDALTIQDASEYVQTLFKARGKSLKRVAHAASYGSIKKDSADHALIRFLVENTDKVIDLLSRKGYLFDILPVIAIEIENRPGSLAEITKKFGEEGININYVYGSAIAGSQKALFVFSPEDIEMAARIFNEPDQQS